MNEWVAPTETDARNGPKRPGRHLQNLLLRNFVLLALIPIVGLSAIVFVRLYKERVRVEREYGLQQAVAHAQQISSAVEREMIELLGLMQNAEVLTAVETEDPEIRRAVIGQLHARLEALVQRRPSHMVGFHIFDAEGRPVARWGRSPANGRNGEAAEAAFFVGALHLAAIHGARLPIHIVHRGDDEPVVYSSLILNRENQIVGVAALVADFQSVFAELARMKGCRLIGVFDTNGGPMYASLFDPSARDLLKAFGETPFRTPAGWMPAPSSPGRRAVAFARVRPEGQPAIQWTAFFDVSAASVLATYRAALWTVTAGIVVIVAVVTALAHVITRRLADPIVQLADAANRLAGGEWDAPLPRPPRRDETFHLTESFERMRGELRKMYDQLKEKIAFLEQSEDALALEKERLAVILRSIEDAVVATDLEGRIRYANRAAEKLLGVSADTLLGASVEQTLRCRTLKTGDPIPLMARAMQVSPYPAEDVQLQRSDGRVARVELQALPVVNPQSERIGAIFVLLDVTDARQMEETRIHHNRIASLGVLAGGIAHDFNNLLAVIMGNLSLLMEGLPPSDRSAQTALVSSLDAAEKARALVGQLLVFAKGGAPIKSATDLRHIAAEALEFATRGSACRYAVTAPDDLWPALADADQLHQVFHNLALNSVQAMPNGGLIEVAFENRGVTEKSPNAIGLAAGRYIRARFRDYGVGIAPEHMPRIFEPYFTTKNDGQGLGLSIVHGIVNHHGGSIAVRPAHPGTEFILHVPAAAPAAPDAAPRPTTEEPPWGPLRVLVLEDEAALRTMMKHMLAHLGHAATLVEEGERAIAAYEAAAERGEPFDVVIADLTIRGGLGGADMARKLRVRYPNARIIAASGYSQSAVMANAKQKGFDAALPKPFTLLQLRIVLGEAMAARPSTDSAAG